MGAQSRVQSRRFREQDCILPCHLELRQERHRRKRLRQMIACDARQSSVRACTYFLFVFSYQSTRVIEKQKKKKKTKKQKNKPKQFLKHTATKKAAQAYGK